MRQLEQNKTIVPTVTKSVTLINKLSSQKNRKTMWYYAISNFKGYFITFEFDTQ